MRAITKFVAALSMVAALGTAASAQDTVDANGTRWHWVPATRVTEQQPVTIPAHWETRCETVTEPGHYETRERRVWVPGAVVYERRYHTVAAHVGFGGVSFHVAAPCTACETVAVRRPGHWETVCESVFVPGCTHTVERQVWIPERVTYRSVCVEKPGHWIRVGCERERGVTIDLHLGD